MHRVEELCRLAEQRGIARHTGFLSDREQTLAQAALHRAGCDFGTFRGGWPGAERKVLCLEPPDTWAEEPIVCLRLSVPRTWTEKLPGHRDYLGSILGLGLERTCLGDLLPDPENPRDTYAFVLSDKKEFIVQNLYQAGNCPVSVQECDAPSPAALRGPERERREATVPSLRADTVLAALMHTSRTLAAEAIRSGRVEINHLPLRAAHEEVFEGDLFTVRGAGRYRLEAVGGKSKKDRIFITFYQY